MIKEGELCDFKVGSRRKFFSVDFFLISAWKYSLDSVEILARFEQQIIEGRNRSKRNARHDMGEDAHRYSELM